MDNDPSPSSSQSSSSSSSRFLHSPSLRQPDDDPRPESPSNSTFLRTAATLDGLARQLDSLNTETSEGETEEWRCCCGGSGGAGGCRTVEARNTLEEKLKLSGEIGNALLQRYEALEKKYHHEVDKLTRQLEVKRVAMTESVARVHNLEKANTTHLQKFAEVTKRNEALEKRYTQALHTQTLTQQSLTHVRAELTSLRATATRQTLALASGAGVEERLADAERRYEEARENAEAEARKARDEARKRKRLEARIAELEGQVKAAAMEAEGAREARAKDAQDLLANAKERLAILHSELSETFHAESPAEAPEYQRTLEDLVANNALLKHDASELSHLLAESREEVRSLREEVDDLRSAVGVARRTSPTTLPRHLASELDRAGTGSRPGHSRTESSPIVGTFAERAGWARMSVSSTRVSPWEHHRKNSGATFTSVTSTEGMTAITSPGLGLGSIGEYGGELLRESGALSPPPPGGRESPRTMFRTSPNGGIAYVLNGLPKRASQVMSRPPVRRSFSSSDRPRPGTRAFSSQGVDAIAEWSTAEDDGRVGTDEPSSPGSEYFRAAEASRKRRSLMLARIDTMSPKDSGEYSPNASRTLVDVSQSSQTDLPSPMSDGAVTSSPRAKRVHRRTLMLLSRSRGVQTDPPEENQDAGATVRLPSQAQVDEAPAMASTGTSPLPDERSETSSLHDARAGMMLALVDHLNRVLTRLRSADVPMLNKRLKKQHLPGDVAHLSRSTMRTLHQEIADLRHHYRPPAEGATVSRKEFAQLVKLLKDIFADLIDLQALVNEVTIDPKVAKKLHKEAYRDEEEAKAQQSGGGLGWIAAPITKLFVTPATEETSGDDALARGRLERGRLQPMAPKAPKQAPVASATTTHVSVEFGGAGIVRRATPALPSAPAASTSTSVFDGLPPSPLVGESASVPASRSVSHTSTSTTADTPGSLAPPLTRPGTLRTSKSRANRNELLGIFAGAPRPITPTGGENWVVVTERENQPARLRGASSQYFADRGGRPSKDTSSKEKKRLSAIVDAVIDPDAGGSAGAVDTSDRAEEPFEPLLQRTLRPRGLSDSSIRSTFVSQSIDPPGGVTANTAVPAGPIPSGRLGGGAGGGGYGAGMLGAISRRWYTWGANEVSPLNPDATGSPGEPSTDDVPSKATATSSTAPLNLSVPESATVSAANLSSTPPLPIPALAARSPPQPIPGKGVAVARSVSPAPTSRSGTTSGIGPMSPASPTTISSSQAGLFGRLASSIVGHGEHLARGMEEEGEGDGEMMVASLTRGGMVGRSASRAGKRWT